MRFNLREVFYFNKTEKRGILVLLLLIILIFLLPTLFYKFNKKPPVDYSVFASEVARFEAEAAKRSPEDQNEEEIDPSRTDYSYASAKLNPFPFNPNGLPESEWLRLGFTPKQVKTIKNFEAKGGRFYKKEDLRKIYGISMAEYSLLESYIQLPEAGARTNYSEKKTVAYSDKPAPIYIDINTADSSELIKIKGIGPAFARRIIKYRELLGGYYTIDQLLEVYGFDADKLTVVAPFCSTGNGVFRKFDLNSATVNELKSHPYLDYYMAKAIVDKRISSGKYKDVNELNSISLIHSDLFSKLSNYVTVQ